MPDCPDSVRFRVLHIGKSRRVVSRHRSRAAAVKAMHAAAAKYAPADGSRWEVQECSDSVLHNSAVWLWVGGADAVAHAAWVGRRAAAGRGRRSIYPVPCTCGSKYCASQRGGFCPGPRAGRRSTRPPAVTLSGAAYALLHDSAHYNFQGEDTLRTLSYFVPAGSGFRAEAIPVAPLERLRETLEDFGIAADTVEDRRIATAAWKRLPARNSALWRQVTSLAGASTYVPGRFR